MEKPISQAEFARLRGCNQSVIHRFVKTGKISQRAITKKGKKLLLYPSIAFSDLEKSLDPAYDRLHKKSDYRVKHLSDKAKVTLQDLYPEIGWEIEDIDTTIEKVITALAVLSFLADHADESWSRVIDNCLLKIVRLLNGEMENEEVD